MRIKYKDNTFGTPGKYNNYLIGGNIFNAFAVGEIGSRDDFFLVGSEPPNESNYPMLTGNILDSEGKVLFRIARNMLVINPGRCSKITSNHIGYEIHDSAGCSVFGVSTKYEKLPNADAETWVTTVHGTFFDRTGKAVWTADKASSAGGMEINCKHALGLLEKGFIQTFKYDNIEKIIAMTIMKTGGAVHELLTGRIEKNKIKLDGKLLMDAELVDCDVYLKTGDFAYIGKKNKIQECRIYLDGPAKAIFDLIDKNRVD